MDDMTDKKIWFITGAARGMGVDIAKAALGAGNAVVATARNADSCHRGTRRDDDLLAVKLDITDPASVEAAVEAAVERFGRIDVLVNNAGNFYAGYFEEISPAQMRAQIETNLFGPMNVTRVVLTGDAPQRSGHVVTISSTAGLIGQEFVAATRPASSVSRAGWSPCASTSSPTASGPRWSSPASSAPTSSSKDPRRSGPSCRSTTTPSAPQSTIAAWRSMNGQQGGDPAKLAAALVALTELEDPPLRFVAGADAVTAVEHKAQDLLAQVNTHRDLSSNLAHDAVTVVPILNAEADFGRALRLDDSHHTL